MLAQYGIVPRDDRQLARNAHALFHRGGQPRYGHHIVVIDDRGGRLGDLVIALMFVSAVGLGPFAGILAMTVGSLGSIGKVYAEAMEAVDRGPITAMEAVGASKRQIIQYAILPQSLPLLTSYTLLLFEGNVRGATILGLVGAGGIGLELTTAMNRYEYGHLAAMVLCIIALATVIDQASAIIRKKIT
ncbi:PhnE/PtxC family ABC transporter permease [Microbacterium amylolyticum]